MTVSILTLMAGGCAAFCGQLLMYFAQAKEDAPFWLEYWGYVFFVFAALLVLAGITEFFKSIALACIRRRARRGNVPPKHRRRRRH